MSFKREGDDQSQLNILKKRRVADLLANFIPEDEATLMKNGRYTCLVCSHRPIFDTVDILQVHRKGKRHLEGMKWFYRKKTKLEKEIQKHHHQSYVAKEEGQEEAAASSAPLLTQTRKITHHALLKTTPYSSCHKRSSERAEQESRPGVSSDCQSMQNVSRHASQEMRGGSSHISPYRTPDRSVADSHVSAPQDPRHSDRRKEGKKREQNAPSDSEPVTEERRKEFEHYLKLKSAGWLQDRSGKWIKDENVEFDSDEDEPPIISQT
ncbi:sodium channel modifier 1 [Engraulis encrasicolus]|uniref:sodium channel modifier 1 n=1 Tax=Engraulis encrasicolus TaxID=184585 RepID=UPI002FD1570E